MADPQARDIVLPADPPPAPPPVDRTPEQHLYAMAEKYRVDPDLALAILKRESNGRQVGPDGQPLTSSAGAQGFFQLLPSTAYGEFKLDPTDPFQNIEAGVRYLRKGMDQSPDGTMQSVASFYHGGPNRQLWGPKTAEYAQGIEADLRARAAAAPTAAPAAAPAGRPAIKPTVPADWSSPDAIKAAAAASQARQGATSAPGAGGTVAQPPPQPPHSPTLWERMTGTTTTVPADLQPELSRTERVLSGTEAPGTGPDLVASTPGYLYEGAKHAYNPTTREGRRNIAGTAAAMALTPAIVAAAPEALAGSAIYGILAGGAASGTGGVLEETGEQVAEALQGKRSEPDIQAIGSAGGQQALQDVMGHAIAAPFRLAGRVVEGPGIARAVSTGMKAERDAWTTSLQQMIDSLRQQAADLRFKFGGQAAARTVATEATVDAARQRAAEALGVGQRTTAANVGVARSVGDQEVADAQAKAAAALQEKRTGYQQEIGPPPPETAAGEAALGTLEGPAKAQLDTLGEAVKAASKAGQPQDISAIQAEAKRLVNEEILPSRQAFPSELPQPPQPGAPPTPPPAIDPQLGTAITDAEREAIARHPVMATIQRILNADPTVKFSDLADYATELANAVDFDSPVANKIEGARKYLWKMMRQQLATHEPYDQAANAYAAARRTLTDGYAGAAAKIGDVEPARIVQMISPNDPAQTATLMGTLTAHNPEAATAVQNAWLYRNVLQGGIEGLGKRLQVLRDAPQFARALFGAKLPATLERYGQMADAWDKLTTSGEQTIAATEKRTAEGLTAAKELGAQRAADIGGAGTADVQAAIRQGRAGARASKAMKDQALKDVADQLRELGINKTAAGKISAQEALALQHSRPGAQQILDAIFAFTVPRSFRGAIGMVRALTGPRASELLAMAANRPEVSKALVQWLANPNTQVSYQVIKRILGQEAQRYGATPLANRLQQSGGGPKIGGTPIIALPPPAPPPR